MRVLKQIYIGNNNIKCNKRHQNLCDEKGHFKNRWGVIKKDCKKKHNNIDYTNRP